MDMNRGPDEVASLSIQELAPLIRNRQISPVEVVTAVLARIERLDTFLRAFITVTPDAAFKAAGQAEAEIMAGNWRGPLHGVPVAHKDTYLTAGVRTTCHSPLYADFVPGQDAAVVAAWKEAGAISMGKTNTYELASGREQTLFGISRNPWNPSRVTGGSSTGSGCALAAGLIYGASGTDGGGSIRAPAALCGVVGFRPTFGLVSRRGVLGSAGSTSCCGPMARTAADVAVLLAPLIGRDPLDANSVEAPPSLRTDLETIRPQIRGVRIGLPAQYFLEPGYASPDVLAAVQRAIGQLGELGAELREISLPHVHLTDAIYEVLAYAESATAYRHLLNTRPHDFGFSTRVGLEVGLRLSATEYLAAQKVRTLVERDFHAAFNQVDLIVTPTAYKTARPPAEDADQRRPHPRRPLSLPGGPSISIPCGFDSEGLPIGLQLGGRPWEDGTVLRAAMAYEEAFPQRRRPDLSYDLAAPPLVLNRPQRDVGEAVENRLAEMRQGLEEALRSASLEGVAPAVRFRAKSN